VTGRVILPDGRYEAAAFPAVLAGGASCVRRSVLEEVGYFPGEFFRQAEEYDLSFRIWHAGYRVERFEDLVFRHDKAAGSRDLACVHRMDTRNNLILLERYLPACMRGFYRRDWIQRYAALARHAGHAAAARRGRREARWWSLREALRGRRLLSSAALEAVFGWRHQADRVAEWAREHGVRRVAVGDFSKNVYATYRACCLCGLEIVAVSDPHRAYRSLRYRGIAVLDDQEAARRGAEGIVLSNTNPAVVERRVNELEALFDVPVLQLWSPQLLGSALRATTPRVPVNRG
jgi:hypothetical protein